MLLKKFEKTLVEIVLQRGSIFEFVLTHKMLDARVGVPLNAVVLVASNMQEVVREDCRHLADESVEKLVGALAGGVHDRIENAELAFDMEWTGAASEIGIPYKPGTAVTRHVEFGNYADAAVMRVGDDLARLFLRIEPGQLGESFAFHAKPLIFAEVPVEDVELHRGHPVEGPLENVDRHEVASAVDQKATPAEARCIAYRNAGNKIAGGVGLDQLQQSFQAAHGSDNRCRMQVRARRGHVQRVRLVLAYGLDLFS